MQKKKKKSCSSPVRRQQETQRLAAGSHGPEAASTHHVLLCGVLVALEDSDPVPTAHVLDLSHRLVPEFLQGRGDHSLRVLSASSQHASSSPEHLPGSSPPERPGGGGRWAGWGPGTS